MVQRKLARAAVVKPRALLSTRYNFTFYAENDNCETCTYQRFACERGSVSESNFPPFYRVPSVRLSFVSNVWHQQKEEVQTTISRVGFYVRVCCRRVDIKADFVTRKRERVCTFTRVLWIFFQGKSRQGKKNKYKTRLEWRGAPYFLHAFMEHDDDAKRQRIKSVYSGVVLNVW